MENYGSTDYQKAQAKEFLRVAKIIQNTVAEILEEGGNPTLFSKSLLYAAIELEKKLTGPANTVETLLAIGTDIGTELKGAGKC